MIRSLGLLFSFLFLCGCASLLYYPHRGQIYDPAKVPLKYEDVMIPGKDGKKIHAWYFPSEGPSRGTFLFFHGNAENLTSHFVGLHWLPALGYSYLIFDYPGYDQSEGQPTPESTVAAGKEALRWLHQSKDQRPLVIYGQSLGGNIALRVALETKSEIPLKAVVVDGSFLSYKSVARSILAKSWITWLFQPLAYVVLSDKYAPANVGDLSPVPLLVVHGEQDQVVPFSEGKKVFEAAQNPKQFWSIPEGLHGNSFFVENGKYRSLLIKYLEDLPSRTSSHD